MSDYRRAGEVEHFTVSLDGLLPFWVTVQPYRGGLKYDAIAFSPCCSVLLGARLRDRLEFLCSCGEAYPAPASVDAWLAPTSSSGTIPRGLEDFLKAWHGKYGPAQGAQAYASDLAQAIVDSTCVSMPLYRDPLAAQPALALLRSALEEGEIVDWASLTSLEAVDLLSALIEGGQVHAVLDALEWLNVARPSDEWIGLAYDAFNVVTSPCATIEERKNFTVRLRRLLKTLGPRYNTYRARYEIG